jgi:CheY-like chemotaxis protein
MVHGLTAQLGGGFALTSAPGEGTRVDLYLPVAEAVAATERVVSPHAIRSTTRPLSVLLVDDEELVRTATAEMVRDLGHSVEEASGAAQGLARLAEGLAVDVIITDYMMPGMNGGALARGVAGTHPHVPVLLITGYTGASDDVVHLPRLAKPFGQAELAEALARLFESDGNVLRFPGRQPGK